MDKQIYTESDYKAIQAEIKAKGELSVIIMSDSMHPVIKVGDILKVQSVESPFELKRFDVLVFRSHEGLLICHYLWSISGLNQKLLTTRALRSRHDDLPFPLENLLGRVGGVQIKPLDKVKIILKNHLLT